MRLLLQNNPLCMKVVEASPRQEMSSVRCEVNADGLAFRDDQVGMRVCFDHYQVLIMHMDDILHFRTQVHRLHHSSLRQCGIFS